MTLLQSLVLPSAIPSLVAFCPTYYHLMAPGCLLQTSSCPSPKRNGRLPLRRTSHAPFIRGSKNLSSPGWDSLHLISQDRSHGLSQPREAGNSNAWKGSSLGPAGPNLRVGTSQPGKEEGETAVGWGRLPKASSEQWGDEGLL